MERDMSEIQEAESKIAEILRDLELETGSTVEGIRLETIETTTHGDSRRQLQAKVCIEMFRSPGNNWSV
jgi:hypothetical protein